MNFLFWAQVRMLLFWLFTLVPSSGFAFGLAVFGGTKGAATTDIPGLIGLKAMYLSDKRVGFYIDVTGAGVSQYVNITPSFRVSYGGYYSFSVPFSSAQGPAVSTSVSYDLLCFGLCLNTEYQQYIGNNWAPRSSLIASPIYSSFAFRLGLVLWK